MELENERPSTRFMYREGLVITAAARWQRNELPAEWNITNGEKRKI